MTFAAIWRSAVDLQKLLFRCLIRFAREENLTCLHEINCGGSYPGILVRMCRDFQLRC